MPRLQNPSAVILLSTYNGETYLQPLMRSLLDQDWADTRIVVRDDGSTDSTRELLARYEGMSVEVRPPAPNLGAARSFMQLLADAPPADATFFADQDDVWHPDKVRRAIDALRTLPADAPALYCTALDIVDADMAPVSRSPIWPRPPCFANALVENVATGCTIALNRAAVSVLKSAPIPPEAYMHDWWAYLAVSAFGNVIYDPEPSIAYRMHGDNVVGLPKGPVSWTLAKIRRELTVNTLRRVVDQALAFERTFGAYLSDDQHAMIARLAATRTLTGRIRFLREPEIHRQMRSDDLAMRILMLAGRSV